MSALSRVTCHAVHELPPEARAALTEALFTVHSEIFSGLSYEEFRDYVVERQAWRTWIYLKQDASGALVGYTSMHVFRLELDGRRHHVIRLEAGTLPAARGRDLTMVYAVLRLLRVWFRHPFTRTCIFAALTHPSSYTFLAHYAPVIWPHVDRKPIPEDVLQEMEQLAARFDLERVDPDNPLLRRVDWVTLESEEDRVRWRSSRRRDTRFYIRANPGYTQGHGLMTYIPVNGMILVRSLARFLSGRAGRIARLVGGDLFARGKPAADGPQAAVDSRIGTLDSHFRHPPRR